MSSQMYESTENIFKFKEKSNSTRPFKNNFFEQKRSVDLSVDRTLKVRNCNNLANSRHKMEDELQNESESDSCLQFKTFEEIIKKNTQILEYYETSSIFITDALKSELLEWLISIHVLKPQSRSKITDIYKICRDGIIFFDLINTLENVNTLRPHVEKPSTARDHFLNFKRLKSFFECKFKNKDQSILSEVIFTRMFSGHEVSFWLLILDIKKAYQKQTTFKISKEISKIDRKSQDFEKLRCFSKTSSLKNGSIEKKSKFQNSVSFEKKSDKNENKEQIFIGNRQKSIDSCLPLKSNYFDKMQKKYKQLHENKITETQKQKAINLDKFNSNKKSVLNDSDKKSTKITNFEQSKKDFLKSIFAQTSNEIVKTVQNQTILSKKKENFDFDKKNKNFTTKCLKRSNVDLPMDLNFFKMHTLSQPVKEFLTKLQLDYFLKDFFHQTLLEDPFRNGFGLCLIVYQAFNLTIKCVCKNPTNIEECRRNFKNAILVLLKNFPNPEISVFLNKVDDVMKGCYNIIFEFILFLEKLVNWHFKLENKFGCKSPKKIDFCQNFDKTYRKYDSIKKISQKPNKEIKNSKKVHIISENPNQLTISPFYKEVIEWLFEEKVINSLRMTPNQLCQIFLPENILFHVIMRSFSEDQLKSLKQPQYLLDFPKSIHIYDALDECITFLRKIKDFPRTFIESKNKLYEVESTYIFGLMNDLKVYQKSHLQEIAKSKIEKSTLLIFDKKQECKFWSKKSKMFLENNELFSQKNIQNSTDFIKNSNGFSALNLIQDCENIAFDEKFDKSKEICEEFLKNFGWEKEVIFKPDILTIVEFQNSTLLKRVYDILVGSDIPGLMLPVKNNSACKNNIRRILNKLLGSNFNDFAFEANLEDLCRGNIHVYAELFVVIKKVFFIQLDQIKKRQLSKKSG